MAIDAGILITEDVIRFWAGTPRFMYKVSTEPAMVENPEVMTKSIEKLLRNCAHSLSTPLTTREIVRLTELRFGHN